MPFEKLEIYAIAIDLIDSGHVEEGYMLVLLQQIRDELREIRKQGVKS